MAPDESWLYVGEGVRRTRKLRGWTIAELSALSGLYAVVYWSQYGLSGEEPPSAVPFFFTPPAPT